MKYLRLADLVQKLGISRSSIYNRLKDSDFPKPIKLYERTVVFDELEVNEYMKMKKLKARRDKK